VTSIVVGLDEALLSRLADEAHRVGMTPEQLAAKALEEFLTGRSLAGHVDPFAFMGTISSDELRGRHVDDLLSKGFGQSYS
jgi:hypothetical protein